MGVRGVRGVGVKAQREIIIVLGRTGQGKTTWVKRYIQGVSRLAVWDPKRSYPVEWPEDFAAWFEQHGTDARFRVGGFYDEDVETVGSIAYACQQTTLVLEECAFVFNPRQELPDWARECIYLGRERGVSVVAVAQRPKSIHIALRSQATRIICFNQREISDCEWIADSFGDIPLEAIPELEPLECLDIEANSVRRYRVQFAGQNAEQNEKEKSSEKESEREAEENEEEIELDSAEGE